MKISKQQWMLIAGVGILAIVYWFFFRKKKAESGYDENVMIFGNESGYEANEVGPGIESGFGPKTGASTQAASCPAGHSAGNPATYWVINYEAGTKTLKLNCQKTLATARVSSSYSNDKLCTTNTDPKKTIPCPTGGITVDLQTVSLG